MNQTVRLAILGVLAGALMAGCAVPQKQSGAASGNAGSADGKPAEGAFSTEIRHTRDGIPHIRAADWGGLGFGFGYAQAQDNLCTLADGFVTYRGERSMYFGADARPASPSTFGQPRNLDADFFFRFVDDTGAVECYRAAQTPELRAIIDGFVAGYNRYLADVNGGSPTARLPACRGKPWLVKIDAADVYRRLIAANLSGGAACFVQPALRAADRARASAQARRRAARRQHAAVRFPRRRMRRPSR